jgi:hypothetical protein
VKQSEAKPTVLRLFREWAEANGKSIPHTAAEGGFVFFTWLRANHPEALDFRATGDPWQTVHIWLRKAGLVTR